VVVVVPATVVVVPVIVMVVPVIVVVVVVRGGSVTGINTTILNWHYQCDGHQHHDN
jgi:hypothetical protein